MKLLERIQTDFLEALKGRDELRRSTLKMLHAALKNKEIAKRSKNPEALSEEEITQVVRTELKRRREAAAEYRKGGRSELAEKEEREAKILEAYLPAQMSEEEIQAQAKSVIEQMHASGPRDVGKVMGALMQKIKGRADGATAQRIVQSLLKGQNS